MRIRARVRTLAARALAESMDVKTMVHVARRILGNYDLHERTAFPRSVPIPNRTAAAQVIDDMVSADMFLEFVSLLMDLERIGLAGRKYKIARLQSIVTEILETGYRYDSSARAFVEDTSIRTTRHWGVLKPGETYNLAFLGTDVAGNSQLVREYGNDTMRRIYEKLRTMATSCAEKRNGRLWSWEGDGGILAFAFEEQHQRAVLAAMELLGEIFLYNLAGCPIRDGVHVRLTVHAGPCEYHENGTELKTDTVRGLWDIDARHGRLDSLVISHTVFPSLEPVVADRFSRLETPNSAMFHYYTVRFRVQQ
jgi:class 3 adenylate cyclase